MKFKIDENLPVELVRDLSAAGHDACTVGDQQMTGCKDAYLLQRIREEGRILMTMDKGIGNIRQYLLGYYAGTILFRPMRSGKGYVLAFIRRHLPRVLLIPLWERLVVVSESGIRFR